MKISGFSYVRNGFAYGCPFTEAIRSVLPVCDEFVVAVGDSTDGTREAIQQLGSNKIKIIDTVWGDSVRSGGKVFAQQSNIALDHTTGDWAFHVQADEVVHEKSLPVIRKAIEACHSDKRVEGFILPFLHFWGDYKHVRNSRRVHKYEVRLFRNKPFIRAFRDSQGFRIYQSLAHYETAEETGRKLSVNCISEPVYHYNGVKTPGMLAKKNNMFGYYYGGERHEAGDELPDSPLDAVDRVTDFRGSHPAVMAQRIQEYPFQYRFNKNKAVWRLKDRLVQPIEDLLGVRFGEYRNYKLLSSCPSKGKV